MTADSQGAKEKSIKIPKLRISEEWGKPAGTSEDRDLIEIFFSRLPQGDFRSKIEHVEKFIIRSNARHKSECDYFIGSLG